MRLALEGAVIPEAKLRDYLLSATHPEGRSKAQFLAGLGYSANDWQRLERDLLDQLALDAQPGKTTPYGRKYEILGMLRGPNGNAARVRTIWIVLTHETGARLVTMIPEAM